MQLGALLCCETGDQGKEFLLVSPDGSGHVSPAVCETVKPAIVQELLARGLIRGVTDPRTGQVNYHLTLLQILRLLLSS